MPTPLPGHRVAPAKAPAIGGRARNRVTASAEIVAEPGPGGTTRLPLLRSQVPLVLRRAPEAVYLVSAAAAPLGGDRLDLRIEVRAGAVLRLRTVAASIALPGLDGGESLLRVTATVAAGGRLEYLPEPVVVADGARHATNITVSVAEGGSLILRDELHPWPPRRARRRVPRLPARRLRRPALLRQALDVSGSDAVTGGPAILSGHRAVGTLLQVGLAPDAASMPHASPGHGGPPPGGGGPWVAVMPLATAPATLVTVLANDAVTLRKSLAIPPAAPPRISHP